MGVDAAAEYEDLVRFVDTVTAASGIRAVTVHARAALLSGVGGKRFLSPAANRSVPPLRHECVHALKRDFPRLAVTLNGGVQSLEAARAHLAAGLDGVMMGRAFQRNPLLLARADAALAGDADAAGDVAGALGAYRRYVDASVAAAAAAVAAGAAPAFAPAQVRQRAERHLRVAAVARAALRLERGGAAGDDAPAEEEGDGDDDDAADEEES
jgi:tRNA-dihydrouridine synthase